MGIFTSRAMRERGRAQIQFMKTRSSSGVGQKLDLNFNIESLRITDLDDDELEDNNNGTSAIYDKLKRQSETNQAIGISQTNNIVESAVHNTDKLRSILKRAE